MSGASGRMPVSEFVALATGWSGALGWADRAAGGVPSSKPDGLCAPAAGRCADGFRWLADGSGLLAEPGDRDGDAGFAEGGEWLL